MLWVKLKTFLTECARVFRITRKPKKDEYIAIIKVSAIGILLIGLIGFIIHIIWQLIK